MDTNLTQAVAAGSQLQQANQIKKTSDISMDDFLKILAASMSNPSMGGSDSSSSSSGTDYISQLVQFTTLEQLNTLGDTLNSSTMIAQQQQAFGLIGKEVKVIGDTSEVTGKVEKVRFANGYATLVIQGKEYAMGALQEVAE
ncbi:flagellar hook capping FlgD N-terminal domain-containing protein [Enterococcus bulliens]